MDDSLVSIIVPIFNAAHRLHACLTSIVRQSHANMEVILIDDGSRDDSYRIGHYFSQRDSRIHLVKQRNQGPSAARNKGIAIAKGEYIQFVDADDTIHPQMTESMLRNRMDADLIICGYKRQSDTYLPHLIGDLPVHLLWNEFGQLFFDTIIQSPCNKLYRSSIIKDHQIHFLESHDFGEDLRFNLAYLRQCEKISLINQALYIYRVNKDSITNRYIPDLERKYQDIYKAIFISLRENESLSTTNVHFINRAYIKSIFHTLANISSPTSPLPQKEIERKIAFIIRQTATREGAAYFPKDIQAKVLKQLFKWKSSRLTYLYFHYKHRFRDQFPSGFEYMKKWIK